MNDRLSKCCCDIEFNIIGLYPNFNDGGLHTITYIFNKFIKQYNIDLNDVDIAFNYPSFLELQKYGQHESLSNINWINSLGKHRMNFFTDFRQKGSDYVNLYNYVVAQKSIALFLGELTEDMRLEYYEYISYQRIPVIHITPDFHVTVKWVGAPDSDYNFYLDNLS